MTTHATSLPLVGIDISKRKIDIALLNTGKIKHKALANSPAGFAALDAWLVRQGVACVHACMESTNVYGEALAEHLYDRGHTVSIVNPARVKGFAQSELSRTKTDKADAAVIARFCAALRPAAWAPEPLEIRHLRALVRRLEALLEMRQQEVNRLQVAADVVSAALREHIAYLDRSIAQVRDKIRDHIDGHPELKEQKDLLNSIPGIGEATIAVALSEFAQVTHFTSAKALAAYIGVAPRQRQSGTRVRGRTTLSKMGRSQLRKAFFMPALVALRYNPILIEMKKRLTAAGKSKMAIVGAAMRKLVHLIYGVLKSGRPFDAEYVRQPA